MSQSTANERCFECSEYIYISTNTQSQAYKRIIYIVVEEEVKSREMPLKESFHYHPIYIRICAACKRKIPPKYAAIHVTTAKE